MTCDEGEIISLVNILHSAIILLTSILVEGIGVLICEDKSIEHELWINIDRV